jgi:hypothetical protein
MLIFPFSLSHSLSQLLGIIDDFVLFHPRRLTDHVGEQFHARCRLRHSRDSWEKVFDFDGVFGGDFVLCDL